MECRKAQSNFTKYLFSVRLSQRCNMQDDQNKENIEKESLKNYCTPTASDKKHSNRSAQLIGNINDSQTTRAKKQNAIIMNGFIK